MKSAARIVLALCASAAAIPSAIASSLCEQAAVSLPGRPELSLAGSDFARSVERLSGAEREAAILGEITSGNIPNFLRRAAPVTLRGQLGGGKATVITVCVLPDYLAIGSDGDHLLIPMGLPTAWVAAQRLGFALPTSKIVDAIYRQASARLRPQPMRPGPAMSSTSYYAAHHQLSQTQRLGLGARLGELTAGHKKDLVLTNRLWSHPGRVAIYGWHRREGAPIQPLSTVHEAAYADYSHGVRFISPVAFVNGEPRLFIELMRDPSAAAILSDEGALRTL